MKINVFGMNTVRFEVIHDIATAQKWWELFSPHRYIYDEWDFRYCFYKYYNYELFFYVGYVNDIPIGLLPLQRNPEKHCLEFWGGRAMNENRIFIKPEYSEYVPQFFDMIPAPAHLGYMTATDPFTEHLPITAYKYTLDLTQFQNAIEYMDKTFSGETKKKFLKHFQKITESNFELQINQFEDLELMFEYNVNEFKEESLFVVDPLRKKIFHDLLQSPFQPHLLTNVINGEKQSVSFALTYKDQFISFNSGINYESGIKDLSAFSRYKRIEYALEQKFKIFDALSGDLGWKEKWKLVKTPQYIFEK